MKKNLGFTLIELMIVVAIIAIIAAIAIPNLLRSRIQANESAAISNLRTVNGSQTAYQAAKSKYAAAFADLAPAGEPAFLDGDWSKAKSGFNFVMAGGGDAYTVNANRVSAKTATRSFFTNESGVIRHATGDTATVASNTIDQPL